VRRATGDSVACVVVRGAVGSSGLVSAEGWPLEARVRGPIEGPIPSSEGSEGSGPDEGSADGSAEGSARCVSSRGELGTKDGSNVG
jgi:hypothetical protein